MHTTRSSPPHWPRTVASRRRRRHVANIARKSWLLLAATRLAFVVLVVTTPPGPLLVTSAGSTVEPLVHAPQAIQSSRVGGIGVIHLSVLEDECAHARPFSNIRGRIGSAHSS